MNDYNILLIDADTNFAKAVTVELNKNGVTTHIVSTRDEVFFSLEASCRRKEKFDLIAIDMHCPFVKHEDIKEFLTAHGNIMPYTVFITSADKYLFKHFGKFNIVPKLELNRLALALSTRVKEVRKKLPAEMV